MENSQSGPFAALDCWPEQGLPPEITRPPKRWAGPVRGYEKESLWEDAPAQAGNGI